MNRSQLPEGWRPRLVATDLDGTFLASDGTVGRRSRGVVAAVEAAGVPFVMVTGRPPKWLAEVIVQTGHRGYAVCANGALIYDLHTERVVRSYPVTAEAAQHAVHLLRAAVPGVAFAAERGGTATDPFVHEPEYRPSWGHDNAMHAPLHEVVAEPMIKLLARHPRIGPDDLLARAREVLAGLVETTHSSYDGLLEISAAGISKASGLAELAAEYGVQPDDVIAFGDMPNDLPMLAWAGWSVAVASGHPDVVAEADEVAPDNDSEGVAQVLERYFR